MLTRSLTQLIAEMIRVAERTVDSPIGFLVLGKKFINNTGVASIYRDFQNWR